MKKKTIMFISLIMTIIFISGMSGCNQASTVTHNIQLDADRFNVYRKMTFVNLYTGDLLYAAEGYFSVQTTFDNEYQGQQEVALVFKVSAEEYKMSYLSIAENVCYVIEQLENTHTNPYHWKIIWYIPTPVITGG